MKLVHSQLNDKSSLQNKNIVTILDMEVALGRVILDNFYFFLIYLLLHKSLPVSKFKSNEYGFLLKK